MASRDLNELLERAAPAARAALDIGHIGRRARRRRRRRRAVSALACVSSAGLLLGVAAGVGDSGPHRRTLVAGPLSSRTIPFELHAGTAMTEIGLLDGTRIRVTVPESVGRALGGTTFASVELHGSVYAGPAPHGWRIEVVAGSIVALVQGGQPVTVPPSSPAGAATVDRPGRRLALQFGPWALVASGDSLTDADVDTLLAGVSLAQTPDGFVAYTGSLPLWTVDASDARLGGAQTAVSVYLGGSCGMGDAPLVASGPSDSYRLDGPDRSPGGATLLCDHRDQLRILLETPRPLTDEEIVRARVDVVTLGPTLAALQRGEHP